jgi:rod shape-determining protein MreC
VVLEKVMSDETVPVGEVVLTSGGDGVFPKGLPVGKVTKVSVGSELFLNIRVRPAANLSRLEEVLVVTKIDERQAQPEQAGPMRAVDILAERLPTVPPKQDAATQGTDKTAAGQPGAAVPNAAVPNIGPTSGTPSPGVAKGGTPQAALPGSGVASGGVPSAATAVVKKAAVSAPSSVAASPVAGSSAATAPATRPATALPKPATKPVQSTVTPKPQPAAQDTPQ